MAENYAFFLEVEELLSRHMTNLIWKGFGPGSSVFAAPVGEKSRKQLSAC